MSKARPKAAKAGPKLGSVVLVGVVGLCVWLAWAVIVNALVWRGPPEIAVRLAPTSPAALTRLAHAEQRAKRMDRAEAFARSGLAKAPFDPVALRIIGMSLHGRGETGRAESIMTLAGNWSLRDSATHLWLFDQRARAGEMASAFAHLDTVLRRRPDLHDRLFAVVKTGLSSDPRVLPALLKRLALAPNWRPAFLAHLAREAEGRRHAAAIAINLHRAGRALSDEELKSLTSSLLASKDVGGLKYLAQHLGLMSPTPLRDPGFEGPLAIPPFGWEVLGGAGATVEVLDDARWKSRALRVEHDSLSIAPLARQLISLEPGRYELRARVRSETGPYSFFWQVSCMGGAAISQGVASPPEQYGRVASLSVPASNCDLQWLELKSRLGERSQLSVALFDDLDFLQADRGADASH